MKCQVLFLVVSALNVSVCSIQSTYVLTYTTVFFWHLMCVCSVKVIIAT